MTALSEETRDFLARCRHVDDPPAACDKAVRDRLIAELGAAAVLGVAASAALGAAGGMGVAGASAVSGVSSAGATVAGTGALGPATAGIATSTFAKTVAGLVLVLGLGAGGMNAEVTQQIGEWPAEIAIRVEPLVEAMLRRLRHREAVAVADADGLAKVPQSAAVETSFASDPRRHKLLIAIARRADHPVAIEVELALLLRAEEALKAHNHEVGLRYLDEHASRFAAGALREKREALRARFDRAIRAAAAKKTARADAPNF